MDATKQVTPAVRTGLKNKLEDHNEKVGDAKTKRTNLRALEAVFRRGVGAYRNNPASVRPSVRSEEQWAYARVNSFLYVLRNGRFRSGKHDTDLLPKGHPMSTKAVSKATYKPTQGMINAARRGLKLREEQPPSRRGGTSVGLARARDIINGKELSEETVLRMHSFFSRHAVDAQAQGFRAGEEGYPSKGLQAHLLWGGDAGKTWSKRIRDQIMRQRNKQMEDTNKEQEVTKAAEAMEHLLMAYNAMIAYSFEDAHQMRADLMELIHSLEHEIAGKPRMEGMEVGKPYHYDDEEDKAYGDEDYYGKEIVMEDGQFCVRSKDGYRSFGCYASRAAAEERLAQIESFADKLKALNDDELELALFATEQALDNNSTKAVLELAKEEQQQRNPMSLFERAKRGEFDQYFLDEEHPAVKAKKQKDVPLATILKAEQRFTMGPVYVPNLEDAHGETIDDNELQQAIWDWVRKGDRTIYLQHSEKPAGEMVEILTMPFPIETALTVPNEGVTKYSFPENTPFMGVIWEKWAWELVKAGELRGYSIGGQAQRVEVDLPDRLSL